MGASMSNALGSADGVDGWRRDGAAIAEPARPAAYLLSWEWLTGNTLGLCSGLPEPSELTPEGLVACATRG